IGQCLPQDFGDKRHGWVQQAKYYIQHASQHDLRVTAGYRLPVAWNLRLSNLQVPVAQLIPRKVVEQLIGTSELVIIQVSINAHAHIFGAVQDPAVGISQLIAVRQSVNACAIHQRELGGVKELGCKITCRSCCVAAQRQVRARVSTARKSKAQRISTVITYPVHWVNAIAQRLRHLPAVLITNSAMQVQVLKWSLRAVFFTLTQ